MFPGLETVILTYINALKDRKGWYFKLSNLFCKLNFIKLRIFGIYSGEKDKNYYVNYTNTIIRPEFVLVLNLQYLKS